MIYRITFFVCGVIVTETEQQKDRFNQTLHGFLKTNNFTFHFAGYQLDSTANNFLSRCYQGKYNITGAAGL